MRQRGLKRRVRRQWGSLQVDEQDKELESKPALLAEGLCEFLETLIEFLQIGQRRAGLHDCSLLVGSWPCDAVVAAGKASANHAFM